MPRPLIIALTLSLVLHGGLLCVNVPLPSPASRAPALRALLRSSPEPANVPEPPPPAETLLKNTIDDGPPDDSPDDLPESSAIDANPAARKGERAAPVSAKADERQMESIRRRLSEYVFYPEQARRLGLEGTVTLFVEVAGDGRVEDVRLVASSGHPILDNAAIRGFYALGRLSVASGYWDYTFALEE
ncbi:MAG: energy transducer TonB [Candidatus Accumulibacter sp.]|jgi:protein TonB|nr:energy transducer TonB [Accumulibacter sp.]